MQTSCRDQSGREEVMLASEPSQKNEDGGEEEKCHFGVI
jgi:hypothetical protein